MSSNNFFNSEKVEYINHAHQDIFDREEMNNSDIGLTDNKTHNVTFEDLGKNIEIPLTIVKVTITMLGIALQGLIIFFEMFGRDSQKRGLINRVSTFQSCT